MTQTHPVRSLGLVTLALLCPLLVACGGNDDEPGATFTSEPNRLKKDATYGTVDELKEAAVIGGYFCKNWKVTNKVALAASSGQCSNSDVFSVYATESDRDAQVNQQRDFGKEFGIPMDSVLVGPNWTINSSEAADLRDKLGGVIFGG